MPHTPQDEPLVSTALAPESTPGPVAVDASALRRVVLGGAVGSFVEWYEFAVYGYLAPVIAVVFFPSGAGSSGLLAAFAVFAVAFFSRPLGGFVWGYVGDRLGRQRTLALTVVSMAAVTALVGVLPAYSAAGVAAPVLLVLLRVLQGVSAGGEISGAASFVAEHSPSARRSVNIAGVQAGSVVGTLVGSVLVGAMLILVPKADMAAWGWRIPFLLAVPFGVAGLWIRRRLEETPYFTALAREGKRSGNPLAEAFGTRDNRVRLAKAFGAVALNGATFFLIVGYLPSFATTTLKLTGWAAFVPPVLALVVVILSIFAGARLADRLGRKRLLLLATCGLILLSYPCFLLMTSGSYGLIAVGLIVFGVLAGLYCGGIQVTIVELFTTEVRVSGHGIAYNLAVAIFGGTAPYLLTWLTGATGSHVVGAYYVIAVGVLSLLVLLTFQETRSAPLR